MTDDPARHDGVAPAGGEPACWAHVVCVECGAPEPEHHPGCASALVPEIGAGNDASS